MFHFEPLKNKKESNQDKNQPNNIDWKNVILVLDIMGVILDVTLKHNYQMYLKLYEKINDNLNPTFKPLDYEHFKEKISKSTNPMQLFTDIPKDALKCLTADSFKSVTIKVLHSLEKVEDIVNFQAINLIKTAKDRHAKIVFFTTLDKATFELYSDEIDRLCNRVGQNILNLKGLCDGIITKDDILKIAGETQVKHQIKMFESKQEENSLYLNTIFQKAGLALNEILEKKTIFTLGDTLEDTTIACKVDQAIKADMQLNAKLEIIAYLINTTNALWKNSETPIIANTRFSIVSSVNQFSENIQNTVQLNNQQEISSSTNNLKQSIS